MVEDDFQLICFDMVSDPSTPGAFMLREAKEIQNNTKEENDITRMMDDIIGKFGEK